MSKRLFPKGRQESALPAPGDFSTRVLKSSGAGSSPSCGSLEIVTFERSPAACAGIRMLRSARRGRPGRPTAFGTSRGCCRCQSAPRSLFATDPHAKGGASPDYAPRTYFPKTPSIQCQLHFKAPVGRFLVSTFPQRFETSRGRCRCQNDFSQRAGRKVRFPRRVILAPGC